jgi:tetratricopeptide (TPR) repeat protein
VKTSPHKSLSAARAVLLAVSLSFIATSAFAQFQEDGSLAGKHRQRKHKTEDAAEQAGPAKFPQATRKSPGLTATEAGGKALNAIFALEQAKQYPQAIQQAEAFAGKSKNAYEQSFAYQLAGVAASESGDNDTAIAMFKKALDSNGLGNDEHYQVMYNLALAQYQTKHAADALATLDRFLTETKTDGSEYLTLKAALLGELNRPLEAAAIYEQQFAKNPQDAKALINAAASYQQAGNATKANALLAQAREKNMLTDAAQYRALYVAYINADKPKEAIAAIDEGLAKGILKPSPDLANAYSVIAQNAYGNGDAKTAIEMYKRAAPIASDGEPALNLARVYFNEGRMAEARQAAQQALQKGVQNEAEARKIAGQKGK